jgi:hypothetical protein
MSYMHYFQQSCENHLRLRARCEPLFTELPEMRILGNSKGRGLGIYLCPGSLPSERWLLISCN